MCGRYTLTVNKTTLAKEFGLQENHLKDLNPRYNIAPSQEVPGLVKQERGERMLELFRWGFIPPWAKPDTPIAGLINARKETIAEKPIFKSSFNSSRCLILADGFYEWRQEGKRKTPYFICLKSRMPFGFAGLWSHWMSPHGREVLTCAIVTTEPNELLTGIHSRMPVILPKEYREEWLDPENHDPKKLLALLGPYPASEMEAYPVSTLVNSPSNDTSECLKPVKS